MIDVNGHDVAEDQGLTSILKSREALQAIHTSNTSYQLKLVNTQCQSFTSELA